MKVITVIKKADVVDVNGISFSAEALEKAAREDPRLSYDKKKKELIMIIKIQAKNI